MSEYLLEFIDFFGLDTLLTGSSDPSLYQVIGLISIAFIGCIFAIMGVRCVFELIKIVTDWSRFK